jgi:Tol biopolymer transport system component
MLPARHAAHREQTMKLIPTARFVPTILLLLGLGACGGDAPDDVVPIPEDVDPTANQQLAWVDRSGTVLESIGPRMNSILDPSISPNSERIAVRGREVEGQTDYLYILEGTEAERLTSNEGFERHMIWSPDGSRIAYSIQNPGGVSDLFIRTADGMGGDQPLIVSEGMHKWYPSWTPDASTVVFHTNNPETQARDLWSVDVSTGETDVVVGDDGIQALARLSRDGRFIAYQSDQDGQMEIYVTTFPSSDARWKVSANGGTWPKWSNDELFYWQGNDLMAVRFRNEGGFSFDPPTRLFTGAQVGMGVDNMMTSYNPEYDVNAEGTRFVVTSRVEG